MSLPVEEGQQGAVGGHQLDVRVQLEEDPQGQGLVQTVLVVHKQPGWQQVEKRLMHCYQQL